MWIRFSIEEINTRHWVPSLRTQCYIILLQNSKKKGEQSVVTLGSPAYLAVWSFTLNQFHAVSRTQQGRQREPSINTLRSPLSAKFWRHCMLSGGPQRRTSPRHQSEELKIQMFLLSRVGIEPTTSRFYSHTFCLCATTNLLIIIFQLLCQVTPHTGRIINSIISNLIVINLQPFFSLFHR